MSTIEPANLDTNNSASNIKLIYEDSESSLKVVRDDVNTFNTRLSVLIGFNATLIRFAMDLPAQFPCSVACYSCLCLKIVTLILLIASIVLSLLELLPKDQETLIYPKSQLTKSDGASELEFRLRIIEKRDEMIHSFLEHIGRKAKRFRQALICLGIATGISALDIITASFFCP